MEQHTPKWFQDLKIFSKINPILIIEGNIFDKFFYMNNQIVSLSDYLYLYYHDQGYGSIVFYDPVANGFFCNKEKKNPISLGYFAQNARLINGDQQSVGSKDYYDNYYIPSIFKGQGSTAPLYTSLNLKQNKMASVVIYNLASRLINTNSTGNITEDENKAYTSLLSAGLEAKDAKSFDQTTTLKNLLILIVNKVNDLPAWFYLNNPSVKIIRIDTPSVDERAVLMNDNYFKTFFDPEIYTQEISYFQNNQDELKRIKDKFIGLTEGFAFVELNSLRNLSALNQLKISQLPSVVDFYRFGVTTNPWEKPDLIERIKTYDLRSRVKGQNEALNKTMAVVKRAITGLSGIQHSSSHSKPRGVLFFAGPTGTGKTETAKTLADLIFRDESNCIRFDMSEFSQPHTDQRLFGAPPGYVGYEAGGQLTNAVREHPFSILLFDEIEKAHPSILDKFLQILEDGRLTDGQGKTVYFSECIIIFTSNLGISEEDPNDPTGRKRRILVNPTMSYQDIVTNVRQGVDNYFKYKLGRPELLNRIGDNIVVYDFIRPEVAKDILMAQIRKIITNLKTEKYIDLKLKSQVFDVLYNKCLGNLDNGGRGIGNIVESYFINPLSTFIFDHNISKGASISMLEINEREHDFEYTLTDQNGINRTLNIPKFSAVSFEGNVDDRDVQNSSPSLNIEPNEPFNDYNIGTTNKSSNVVNTDYIQSSTQQLNSDTKKTPTKNIPIAENDHEINNIDPQSEISQISTEPSSNTNIDNSDLNLVEENYTQNDTNITNSSDNDYSSNEVPLFLEDELPKKGNTLKKGNKDSTVDDFLLD